MKVLKIDPDPHSKSLHHPSQDTYNRFGSDPMSSPGLIRGPGNESSTETTLTSRDTRPDQNSIVSLDAVAAAVADARRALRELHEQTSTLELITSQLHRHAVLLQLIQTALALNLEQGGEASTHQESTQRQVSVDSLSPGLHTLAIPAWQIGPDTVSNSLAHCADLPLNHVARMIAFLKRKRAMPIHAKVTRNSVLRIVSLASILAT
ncbi:hypothetical protein PCANC_02689 [Puccinia coronata f. sp. avenae]|uniref:Uncharacterized protein n=1 Tax=Puccinia coronata f. sp. avenae TaxID=200324 RepID=A0A2N5S4J5_9BASI|nr:hypothetical protein PCANC_22624 [Puccinia coronata f. sp. avenae]PLW54985.1 hypothetical protein PCANC_02689 [Puccinia coronata f. sp. avenae]